MRYPHRPTFSGPFIRDDQIQREELRAPDSAPDTKAAYTAAQIAAERRAQFT